MPLRLAVGAGLLLALLCWLSIGASAAFAGDLRVKPHVRGAGSITYNWTTARCDYTDNLDERQEQACDQQVRSGLGSVGGTITATPAPTPQDQWEFVGWENCDFPSGNTCSMASPVFSAPTFQPVAIFNDRRPPAIALGSTRYPANRTVEIDFSVDEPLSSLSCQLDGGEWTGCHSSATTRYSDLSEGQHTLRVFGADRSGQGGLSDVRTFTIVETTLGARPDRLVRSRDARFSFSSVAGTAFECRLDGAAWSACASPRDLTVPTDGSHTFGVRATNGAVTDPEPAEYTWTVDTEAPDTVLDPTVGPAPDAEVRSDTAEFAFRAEPGATFECRLDTGGWKSCTTPYRSGTLPGGKHTFAVRATDEAGNTDASPATRSWVIVVDGDGDGYARPADCNDSDPAIHPGAAEVLDNDVDENCDGIIGVNRDRDGDGYVPPADCRDNDAAIHPNATDRPRNGVDEDCDGKDADYPRIASDVVHAERGKGGATIMRRLAVTNLEAGTKITVRCRGRGCPKARFTIKPHGTTRVSLVKRFRRARLRPGAVLDVSVTAPERYGKALRLTIRRGKPPRVATLQIDPETGQRSPW